MQKRGVKMSYEKSPIDEFFYGLYGFYPEKKGQAYELLVMAAMKALYQDSEVCSDQHIKGTVSQQSYQIDGTVDEKISIEAKDYTLRNSKVGRPDVQKQEGGLVDLPFESGIFASATGYSNRAEKYAKATYDNPRTKPIDLYEIRPSTEDDEKGRVKTVIINIHMVGLDFQNACFKPMISSTEIEKIGEVKVACIDKILNEDGSVCALMKDWTASLNKKVNINNVTEYIEGIDFEGKYIRLPMGLVKVDGIKYRIPLFSHTEEIRIDADGKTCLLVKNLSGEEDTLLTETQLKKIRFRDKQVMYD